MADTFKLELDRDQIENLANEYVTEGDNKYRDQRAFEAGQRIVAGETTMENLAIIFEWKTRNRGRSRLEKNKESKEVTDALTLATSAKSPRSAIAVLCGLHGVDIPVASAIMTCIRPNDFTVIDFRALETLGCHKYTMRLNFYLEYLDYCIERAKELGINLRTLDRALWQSSAKRARGRQRSRH